MSQRGYKRRGGTLRRTGSERLGSYVDFLHSPQTQGHPLTCIPTDSLITDIFSIYVWTEHCTHIHGFPSCDPYAGFGGRYR